MLPDLDSLRCFEAAARHLNFRAAASEVALSPPAFTTRIRNLEHQLDARLFARTTRSVTLTDAGAALVPVARSTLDAARGCYGAVHGGRRPDFEITIGTRFELGLSWLTPALAALATVAPERTLHLSFGDSPELIERTRRAELDATITSARLAGAPLAYALLHAEHYAFVAHPSIALDRAEEASAHTLLDAGDDLPLFRYFLDARPVREVWSFRRVEKLGAIAAIRYRALEAAGVCVLPRYLIQGDLDAGRLIERFARTKLKSDHFRLVWRAGHPLETELHELAGHLREIPLS